MLPISAFKIRIIQLDEFSCNITDGKEIFRLDDCEHPSLLGFNLIEADPFLFVYKSRLFLFYECVRWGKYGVIKMVSTEDLKSWTKPIVVLKEKFHLSYPFVFYNEKTDGFYMIPETSASKEVRIYKAIDGSLTKFEYLKTILRDTDNAAQLSFSDSSIFEKDGIYYLHTTRQIKNKNYLELYISSDIFGPYKPHPLSPLFCNMKYGRNGGSLFCINNRIYRPAMDCSDGYGYDLGLFEVIEISPQNYVEVLLSRNLLNSKTPFYKDGGHHFNCVGFNNHMIISTDARSWKKYFINRLFNKVIGLYRLL